MFCQLPFYPNKNSVWPINSVKRNLVQSSHVITTNFEFGLLNPFPTFTFTRACPHILRTPFPFLSGPLSVLHWPGPNFYWPPSWLHWITINLLHRLSYHWQGNIGLNTANNHRYLGMYFLIFPLQQKEIINMYCTLPAENIILVSSLFPETLVGEKFSTLHIEYQFFTSNDVKRHGIYHCCCCHQHFILHLCHHHGGGLCGDSGPVTVSLLDPNVNWELPPPAPSSKTFAIMMMMIMVAIKASEMLVAPRISEYFLKCLKF